MLPHHGWTCGKLTDLSGGVHMIELFAAFIGVVLAMSGLVGIKWITTAMEKEAANSAK